MTTISKFYLHDATTSDTGTMPSTAQTATTIVATVTGASTARSMDASAGATQVGPTQVVGTIGLIWWRQFVSAPIVAQTFTGAGTITITVSGACKTSSGARPYSYRVFVGVWRPSTGALVGTLLDSGGTNLFSSSGTAETAGSSPQTNGAGFTTADGDVLVVQLYDNTGASGGTHTLYYDGTTEADATSNASFVSFSVPVTMYTPPADPNPGISEARGGTV